MAEKRVVAVLEAARAAAAGSGARLRLACSRVGSGGRQWAMRCSQVAAALLPHVSLLMVVIGGAALATAARLKWDPSAYVPLRQVLPAEYRVLAVALAAGGAALLLLAHLAAAALAGPAPRARRALLLLYAGSMLALCAAEGALAGWLGARLAGWRRSAEAQQLAAALDVPHQLRPALHTLGLLHPLPRHIEGLIEEAEADVPVNVYVGVVACAALGALQAAAVLLALLAALGPAAPLAALGPAAPRRRSLSWSSAGSAASRAPLRAKYRAGRLVLE